MEYKLNFDDINWSNIIEEGIGRAAKIFEQEMRMRREKATSQSYLAETEKVGFHIMKRQLK